MHVAELLLVSGRKQRKKGQSSSELRQRAYVRASEETCVTGHIDLRSCVLLNMYLVVVSHLKLEKLVYRQLNHINLQEPVLLLFLYHQ